MRAQTLPGAARFFTAGRGITMPEPGRSDVPYWINNADEGRKAVQELAAQKVDIVKIWVDDRDGQVQEAHARPVWADHRRGAQARSAGDRAHLHARRCEGAVAGRHRRVRPRRARPRHRRRGAGAVQEAAERGRRPEPSRSRRQDRRELVARQPFGRGVQEASGGRHRSAGASGAVRHSGAQPGER